VTSSPPPDRPSPTQSATDVEPNASAAEGESLQGAAEGEQRGDPARGSPEIRTPSFRPDKSYRETRRAYERDFERRYAEWLLNRHNGNLSAAAREARMDRKYLYELARRHGLRDRRRPPTDD
jgi:DNA-binding NtrC family response regulator